MTFPQHTFVRRQDVWLALLLLLVSPPDICGEERFSSTGCSSRVTAAQSGFAILLVLFFCFFFAALRP